MENRKRGVGWASGLGTDVPLADARMPWREGSIMDFGWSTHYVNRAHHGHRGSGKSRQPCLHDVENQLSIMRLASIHCFGS